MEDDRVGRRRIISTMVALTALALFLAPPIKSMIGYWIDDKEYVKRCVGCLFVDDDDCLWIIKMMMITNDDGNDDGLWILTTVMVFHG